MHTNSHSMVSLVYVIVPLTIYTLNYLVNLSREDGEERVGVDSKIRWLHAIDKDTFVLGIMSWRIFSDTLAVLRFFSVIPAEIHACLDNAFKWHLLNIMNFLERAIVCYIRTYVEILLIRFLLPYVDIISRSCRVFSQLNEFLLSPLVCMLYRFVVVVLAVLLSVACADDTFRLSMSRITPLSTSATFTMRPDQF